MLRSILVALDDTDGAVAARDVAIELARRTGAALTAAVVLDRPHTQSEHEPVPIGGAAFKARRDAKLTRQAEEEAEAALAACAAAAGGQPYAVLRLEDAPEDALVRAGASHDLIVVGRDCTLGRQQTEDSVAPVIEQLLRDGARPLLVVPPGSALPAEGPVLAAYDGSAPSREAFHLFALLGLAGESPVRVAAVEDTREAALKLAEEGAAGLRRHRIVAEPLPIAGRDAAELLLAQADTIGARMLVMGAFGGSSFMRLLVGSTTHRLLRDARMPIFIHR
ncbi:MAG TPA: universal stress protein [Falsiroseomonas sp.]|jgi:nucleotide-binding universal stress UspA family protein|nr:universal stress protein [Falsiroseomonas sp.]